MIPEAHTSDEADVEEASDRVDDEASNDESSDITYDITSYGADYTVDGIVKRLRKEAFYVPSFQRSYVWSLSQASRFVESLLLGLPVPGVFVAKEENTNRHLVIDGQQRLKTLLFFFDGRFREGREFRLKNVDSRWNERSFDDLDDSDRLGLEDSIIHFTIFKQNRPTDDNTSIYHVFERLNTGGAKLYPQEIRNCVDHGPFTRFLERCNEVEAWREIFGKKSTRMKDQELIMRFLAFHEGGVDCYKRPMRDFLNTFSRKRRHISDEEADRMFCLFKRTIVAARNVLGKQAFKPGRNLNAAVYDAVMMGLACRLRTEPAPDADSVRECYRALLDNEDFKTAYSRSTANEDSVRTRQELAIQAFSTA